MAKSAKKAAGKKTAVERAPKLRIVAAAGTAVASNVSGNADLAARMESAMSKAVLDCYAEGVTDDKAILKRKLAARDEVLGGNTPTV